MAAEDELVALSAIEEEVISWAADTGAAYVGRVTGAGCRTYFCYTAHDADDAAAFAEHLTMQSGYKIGLKLEEEAGKQTYWDALYPEPEERPQTSDMKVIKQLEAYNDNLSSPRRIDHFAYFDSRQQIGGPGRGQERRRAGMAQRVAFGAEALDQPGPTLPDRHDLHLVAITFA